MKPEETLILTVAIVLLSFALAGVLMMISAPPSSPTLSRLDTTLDSNAEDDRLSFSTPSPSPDSFPPPETSTPGGSETATLRGLEGTYSATANGITVTLRIWDADDDTAEGSLYSTNMGTRRCVVASLGGNLLTLIFLDSSELRVRYAGTSSMTFVGSGVVLRRR